MAKGKARAAVVIPVPQNRDEARDMMAAYGTALRDLDRIEIEMNQEMADVKQRFVERGKTVAQRADDFFKGLQAYCEANRITLTENGATKTVDFGTGKVSWRWNPAKVNLRGKVDDIIARIKLAGDEFGVFLRQTVEIDKVQMLRNPNLAEKIDGVRVASAGETFIVEPMTAEQIAEVV